MKPNFKNLLLLLLFFSYSGFAIAQIDRTYKSGIEHLNSKNYFEAVQFFNKIIYNNSKDPQPEPYYFRGLAKYNLRDFSGANNDFSESINLKNNYFEAYNARAQSYFNQGNYKLALRDYDETIRITPIDNLSYYSRALVKKNLGEYMGAISDLNKSINLVENYANAFSLRGELKYLINDFNGSLEDYQNANKLNQKNIKNLIGISNAQLKLNNFNEAIKYIKQAIDINSENSELWNLLGFAYINSKELNSDNKFLNEAVQAYSNSINLNKENPDAYFGRGFAKEKLGDFTGAKMDFDLAEEFDPKKYATKVRWKDLKIEETEYKKILSELNISLEINQNIEKFDNLYFNRGYSKIKLNDYNNALKDLDLSITINPFYAPSYFYRAIALSQIGMLYKAIFDCENALILNPSLHQSEYLIGINKIALGDLKGCENLSKAGELGNKKAYEKIDQFCN